MLLCKASPGQAFSVSRQTFVLKVRAKFKNVRQPVYSSAVIMGATYRLYRLAYLKACDRVDIGTRDKL